MYGFKILANQFLKGVGALEVFFSVEGYLISDFLFILIFLYVFLDKQLQHFVTLGLEKWER